MIMTLLKINGNIFGTQKKVIEGSGLNTVVTIQTIWWAVKKNGMTMTSQNSRRYLHCNDF